MNALECSLQLIIGPMFSGKTTELLRIAKRLQSIQIRVLLINYSDDKRYSETEMMTHDKEGLPCLFSKNLNEIDYENYDVICINEGQFFVGLLNFCKEALKVNKSVYVCGLDGDYKQQRFGEILELVPLCDKITKLHAFCSVCKNGTPVYFTKRLTESEEQVLIGTNEYIPVCRKHL